MGGLKDYQIRLRSPDFCAVAIALPEMGGLKEAPLSNLSPPESRRVAIALPEMGGLKVTFM